MSRIGKMPITIPAGVTITQVGNVLTVKGPKGSLNQSFPDTISFRQEAGVCTVERPDESKDSKAKHGLSRALLFNMVTGVTVGYAKELDIQGTGYRAAKAGSTVTLQLGYSHPVTIDDGSDYTVEVTAPNRLVVRGLDKQIVGEIAAKIRGFRPPEPYHGKGVRYLGEVVRLKAGKAGGKK